MHSAALTPPPCVRCRWKKQQREEQEAEAALALQTAVRRARARRLLDSERTKLVSETQAKYEAPAPHTQCTVLPMHSVHSAPRKPRITAGAAGMT